MNKRLIICVAAAAVAIVAAISGADLVAMSASAVGLLAAYWQIGHWIADREIRKQRGALGPD